MMQFQISHNKNIVFNSSFWITFLIIHSFFFFSTAVSLSQNVPPAATASVSPASVFSGGASPSTLSALVSQHRLLELSRFGLRGYDLAQHMLTQQGAVSKLLGKC